MKHGGDEEMVQWYHNYMTHRDIIVEMHGETMRFTTGIGFPQGGVCSAKFWLVAFDYAIQIINRYAIEGNGYADDCSALFGGPRLDHALKRLQKMLDDLSAWGRSCGLEFNPDKSVVVVFSRRRKPPPFKLKIGGKEIDFQESVKYLGITLDKKLYWTTHIEERISKAKRFLGHVASLTRKNWGPKPRLMRWAYTSVVRPMLVYGAMIWGHRAPELAAKLRRVNRMAFNTFASFPRSTPTAALELMLDVMPLHIFCFQEGMMARIRLNEVAEFGWSGLNANKTHSISHMRYWQNKLNQHGIDVGNTDKVSRFVWHKGFRINQDSFSGQARHRSPTQYNVYTDGSRKDEQTGAGCAIFKGKTEVLTDYVRLPDYATVFQAEIKAIERAATLALTQKDIRYVKIFVDSQAAIKALDNHSVRSRAVADAIGSLNELAKQVKSVQIVWIPAHKGHVGNERADDLAKRGSECDRAERLVSVRKPACTIRTEVRNAAYAEWCDDWQSQKGINHTKSFYGKPDMRKAKFVIKLARIELGRFVRIVTGHNNLNFFQTKIGLWKDSRCRFCGEGPKTITHLIRSCPRHCANSREMFHGSMPGPDMSWSVRNILDFSYIPSINRAYEGTWAHDDPLSEGLDSSG